MGSLQIPPSFWWNPSWTRVKLDQVFGYLRMTSDKQFIITDYAGKICASSQGDQEILS